MRARLSSNLLLLGTHLSKTTKVLAVALFKGEDRALVFR